MFPFVFVFSLWLLPIGVFWYHIYSLNPGIGHFIGAIDAEDRPDVASHAYVQIVGCSLIFILSVSIWLCLV